jgi:CRP-like cAMP-binding protein
MPVDELLRAAVRAVNAHEKREVGALDDLTIATYVTDAAGVVRYHNRACVSFAGRVPRVGIDRWCVSWELYTEDGRRLPHDLCPMAISIGEKRAINGARAIALRPDRTSIRFEPSPIPLFDDNDCLIGAVNLLRAVGDGPEGAALWAEAARCRRLAWCVDDGYAALQTRALNCEQNAIAFEMGGRPVPKPIMATRNALLQEIEPAAIGEYARVIFEPGTVLLSAGAPIDEVYLIEAGMASVVARQGRREVDVAVVGSEGMVGFERLLGAENALHTTVIRFSGSAIRMPANTAVRLNTTEPLFAERQMSFVRGLQKQLAENCAANALLSVESRLARWLLSASERVGPNLMITHEVIASVLGTRRATVTVALHILEGEKAIRSTRARVSVLDHERLELLGNRAGYESMLKRSSKLATM